MSTTAVEPTTPTLPTGVLGNPPATDVGAAAAFALAVQLALGVLTPTPGTPAATTDPATDPATGPDPGATAPDSSTTEDDADAEPAPGVTPDPVPVLAVLPAVVLPVAPRPAATAAATAPTDDLAVDVAARPPAPTAPPATVTDQPVTEKPGTQMPGTQMPGTEQTATGKTATGKTGTTATDAEPTTARPGHAVPEPTAGTPAPAPTPTAAPLAATSVASPSSHPSVDRAVATQVIPEVTKLFTNGDGVHRVTLELNPRALGEVKVVLTVRNGDVHVRLAAGTEAREALAHSAGDLTRALEHIGIKDHKLVLAELPGVTASASTQTFSDTTEHRHQDAAFTGRFETGHHHDSRQPRMGDDSSATDGTDHDHGSRTRGDRSIHEVSHVPGRGGVDLRM